MSAKYQDYEEYKGSRVEWVGVLPSILYTKQVRYLLKESVERFQVRLFLSFRHTISPRHSRSVLSGNLSDSRRSPLTACGDDVVGGV